MIGKGFCFPLEYIRYDVLDGNTGGSCQLKSVALVLCRDIDDSDLGRPREWPKLPLFAHVSRAGLLRPSPSHRPGVHGTPAV